SAGDGCGMFCGFGTGAAWVVGGPSRIGGPTCAKAEAPSAAPAIASAASTAWLARQLRIRNDLFNRLGRRRDIPRGEEHRAPRDDKHRDDDEDDRNLACSGVQRHRILSAPAVAGSMARFD